MWSNAQPQPGPSAAPAGTHAKHARKNTAQAQGALSAAARWGSTWCFAACYRARAGTSPASATHEVRRRETRAPRARVIKPYPRPGAAPTPTISICLSGYLTYAVHKYVNLELERQHLSASAKAR